MLEFIAGLALGFTGPAWADPDEAWLSHAPLQENTRPLLVIVLDTSSAMGDRIMTAEPYDPGTDYTPAAGGTQQCDAQRVYWRRGPGPVPDCARMTGLPITASATERGLTCGSANAALARHGYFVTSRAAQWQPAGNHWGALRADSVDAVECRNDRGRHGSEAGQWFAADGPAGPWSESAASEIDWDAAPHGASYVFYSGNFLNYLVAARRTTESTLADAATALLSATVDATDELDIALIRFSDREPDAEGGFVVLAPALAAQAAARLPTVLAGLPASIGSPLAETMTEVAAWLSGGIVHYGDDARADVSARDPQDTARYQSPFSSPCRAVTIAVATAGTSTQDNGAQTLADELPGFAELTGGCGENCLPAIAQWLAQSDIREDQPAKQFVTLNWLTSSPPPALVAESLNQAGGKVEFAGDPLAFANVVARSLQQDRAVPSGAQLSAAGLLLTSESTHEPAVIYGLSAPQARQRWLGNLLRYGLRAPTDPLTAPLVVGRDSEPALDPDTGMPWRDSTSVWSDRPDGDALLSGSAAGRLPVAESRRLYSDVTPDALTSDRNRLTPGNPAFSPELLGLGSNDHETPDAVITWLLNQRMLGDPGQHAPVSVSDEATGGRTTFLVTHDGLLHAFDAVTGIERWAFIPRPMLARLPELMRDESTLVRSHGMDGPLLVHRHDPDGNFSIDPSAGEHLWLVFGLGRGGSGYYALDVASPNEPRLMWSLESDDLDDNAESWPEPVISRLSIDGSGQDPANWIIVLAGGYDRAYDFTTSTARASGASLSILDAGTGRRLWRAAGNAAEMPDLQLPEMTASLPSAPRVLDLDGDGFADRIYVIDIDGGLWRVDLQNNAATTNLARARLVAQLGGEGRRFYSTPDTAVIQEPLGPQFAISIGSGWLSRPRDARVTDRVYSIRDREPAGGTLREADLHDATDGLVPMPAGARGWFVRLDAHGPGEKVIGSSLTFDHRLHFLTYQPEASPASDACGPPMATRRLRMFDVRTGLPANRMNLPGDPDERELPGSGLPAELRFAFPGQWEGACPECRGRPFGLAGPEIFDAGFGNDPVKTSWRKIPIEPDSP